MAILKYAIIITAKSENIPPRNVVHYDGYSSVKNIINDRSKRASAVQRGAARSCIKLYELKTMRYYSNVTIHENLL